MIEWLNYDTHTPLWALLCVASMGVLAVLAGEWALNTASSRLREATAYWRMTNDLLKTINTEDTDND